MALKYTLSKRFSLILIIFILLVLSPSAYSQGSSQKAINIDSFKQDVDNLKEAMNKLSEISSTEKFAGAHWGVGIAMAFDYGHRERVNSAELDAENKIRVTADNNITARIMLETHYFFLFDEPHFKLIKAKVDGHGPFLVIQPGSDTPLESLGFGWMVGFRHDKMATSSFNLGIALIIDPDVQVLADGLDENAHLPKGETEIRYRKTTQGAFALLASFSF